ncbi:ATP-binding cassette domain-containing protein [Pseudonocardia benzenivorans]
MTGEVAATFDDISGAVLRGISFTVARGEILGVTGLAGSGFDELPYVLAGARPGSGTVALGGRRVDVAGLDPRAAIAAGIVLIPADRARLGVIGEVSIRENVALPRMQRFFRGGLLREGAERAWVRELVDGFGVLHGGVDREMNTLSGGNQQKTVLAKWLAGDPDLILLHEPTQGVDVGGRFDIYRQLRDAADRGAAVVAAGESPEELAELCDRVLIVKDGALFGELRGARVEKHAIVDATLSETPCEWRWSLERPSPLTTDSTRYEARPRTRRSDHARPRAHRRPRRRTDRDLRARRRHRRRPHLDAHLTRRPP